MSHPSEAGHWYAPDGTPCYEVKARDGSMRPTTLRDAKKMGLYPSVTGIIRCAAAPGLERWKLDQMLHAALTLPRGTDEPEKDWIGRVWQDSQETARKASERGTAIHAAIQGYYEGKPPLPDYAPHIANVVLALRNWADFPLDHMWVAEKSFAHPLGFGGKVDLHCGGFVVDIKTKEFGPDDDLKTWDEQSMQLAAYMRGLQMPHARAAICYVSVTHPGIVRLIEIDGVDLERGWECFRALLVYHQWKNKHWTNEALQGIGRKSEPRAGAMPAAA